jgi:hypothetical protein
VLQHRRRKLQIFVSQAPACTRHDQRSWPWVAHHSVVQPGRTIKVAHTYLCQNLQRSRLHGPCSYTIQRALRHNRQTLPGLCTHRPNSKRHNGRPGTADLALWLQAGFCADGAQGLAAGREPVLHGLQAASNLTEAGPFLGVSCPALLHKPDVAVQAYAAHMVVNTVATLTSVHACPWRGSAVLCLREMPLLQARLLLVATYVTYTTYTCYIHLPHYCLAIGAAGGACAEGDDPTHQGI